MSTDPYRSYDPEPTGSFGSFGTTGGYELHHPEPPRRPMSAGRRVVSIILVVLGTGCLVGGAVMVWVDTHVFDTDEVVSTTHTMLQESSIRELIRTELDQRIVGVLDPAIAGFVDPAVVSVLDDPRFAKVLDDAVRTAHTTLVAGSQEDIVFSLADVLPIVTEKLDAIDPSIVPQLPDLSTTLDYTLTQRSELPKVWDAVDRFHRAATALLIFGIALIALALVIGPSRWALLLGVGIVTALFALGVQLGSNAVRRTIEHRIDEPGTRLAASDVAKLFTAPLERQMTVLMVIGGIVAVAGVVTRLLRPQPKF